MAFFGVQMVCLLQNMLDDSVNYTTFVKVGYRKLYAFSGNV